MIVSPTEVKHTYRLAQFSVDKSRRIVDNLSTVRVSSAFSCAFFVEMLPRALYIVYEGYKTVLNDDTTNLSLPATREVSPPRATPSA
jgi:hypothetical protein